MKAIIYTRVSTEEQARDGMSLATQQLKCEMQAKVLDMELMGTVSDPGKSAKNMERPGIQQIIEQIRQGAVEALVVYKLDRLTRNIRDLNEFIDLCMESGVQLISVMEALNTGTASGRMIINMLGTIAQWEREIIVERVTEALDYRKKNGLVYSSSPPYGKKAVDGRLVVDEDEQNVIKSIIYHRERDLSFERIAVLLEKNDYSKTRSGKPWAWQSVQKIWKDNQEVSRETVN